MSTTESTPSIVRWRPLAGRYRRAAFAGGLTIATLLASAFAGHGTSLVLESWTTSETNAAYVNNTYNYFVDMRVLGPQQVTIVSARSLDAAPGLIDRDPLVGWKCGYAPHFVAAGDDLRRDSAQRLWLASERPVSADQAPCPYLNVRVVPTRKGILRLGGFEVVYRVGSRLRTARLEYQITFHVDHEGIDPTTPYARVP